MAETFDPYYTWLAIPPEEQPPNHYRLLGVRPFEDNPEVIQNAADQRMAHLRVFQTGKRGQLSQKLLNEVAAAKVCLLNRGKKADYDRRLRQQMEAADRAKAEEADGVSVNLAGFFKQVQQAQAKPAGRAEPPAQAPTAEKGPRRRLAITVGIAAGGLVALLLVIILAVRSTSGGAEDCVLVFGWPQSEREGLELRIDQQAVSVLGTGPLEHRCEPGTHRIHATRQGFEPYEETVTVEAGQRRKIEPVWSPQAYLILEWPATTRRNGKLEIDGKAQGLSGLVSRANHDELKVPLKAGRHAMRALRPGFEPYAWEVEIAKGKDSRVKPVWKRVPAGGDSPDTQSLAGRRKPGAKEPVEAQSDGRGLSAQVYEGSDFLRHIETRVDPYVHWIRGANPSDPGVRRDNFSIRWTGWLRPPGPGRHKLILFSDGLARLWVDGNMLIDRWDQPAAGSGEADIELTTQPHTVKIEYYHATGPAIVSFRWVRPDSPVEHPVPAEAFFHDWDVIEKTVADLPAPDPVSLPADATASNGLSAELSAGNDFAPVATRRIDQQVEWFWGQGAPDPGVPPTGYSVRWSGWLQPASAGVHKLDVVALGAVRVWIDEQLLVNLNSGDSAPQHREASVELTDQPHPIRVEYQKRGQAAMMSVRWVPPGQTSPEAIPHSALLHRLPKADTAMVAGKPSTEPGTQRLPVPSDAEQQRIAKEIDTVYGFTRAESAAEKLDLARKLLAAGRQSGENRTEQYVLWKEAIALGAGGGDAALVAQGVDALAADFDVDALDIKQKALPELAKAAKSSERIGSLVTFSLGVVDEALARKQYDAALQVVDTTYRVCQRSAGKQYRKQAYDCRNEVQRIHRSWQECEAALVTLKAKPDDRHANRIAGRWYCFQEGDWEQGLPYLANSDEKRLRPLAEQELTSPPSEAADQINLADAWWELAQKSRAETKVGLLLHAGSWYRRAQPNVASAVVKLKLTKRLDEIDRLAAADGGRMRPGRRSGLLAGSTRFDPTTAELVGTLQGHTAAVRCVLFSPDGSILVSGSADRTLAFWDVAKRQPRGVLPPLKEWVLDLALSSDGAVLAVACRDRTVSLWNPARGQLRGVLPGHSGQVSSVAFSADGSLLASGSYDQTILLWDLAKRRPRGSITGYGNAVHAVAFSPDGSVLATGGSRQPVKLWDVATGKLVRTLVGSETVVTSVAYSPDGSILASSGYDNLVKLWNPATGDLLRTLAGHTAAVESIAFSADGSMLASSGHDKTAKVWDVATGEDRRTLEGHSGEVWSVAFSPDNSVLATASEDCSIRLWGSASGKAPSQ